MNSCLQARQKETTRATVLDR